MSVSRMERDPRKGETMQRATQQRHPVAVAAGSGATPDELRELANAIEAAGAICYVCGSTTTMREEFRGWCPYCGAEAPYALGSIEGDA